MESQREISPYLLRGAWRGGMVPAPHHHTSLLVGGGAALPGQCWCPPLGLGTSEPPPFTSQAVGQLELRGGHLQPGALRFQQRPARRRGAGVGGGDTQFGGGAAPTAPITPGSPCTPQHAESGETEARSGRGGFAHANPIGNLAACAQLGAGTGGTPRVPPSPGSPLAPPGPPFPSPPSPRVTSALAGRPPGWGQPLLSC